MNQAIILLLEITVGVITILGYRMKNNSGVSIKELIRSLEEKDREIERLKIAKHAAEMRFQHHANECKRTHQHLQTS